jgi:hypothetical protein
MKCFILQKAPALAALSNLFIFRNLGQRIIESTALVIPEEGRNNAKIMATAISQIVSAG